jgi:DNA-binding transcriptional MerR regulator
MTQPSSYAFRARITTLR